MRQTFLASLAGQTLFFSFLFIGGVVGRKIIVWSNSHAKFVLHCQQYFALRQAVVYLQSCAHYFHELGRASYGCSYSRSQIFSACGCFAQPPFSFPVQEILGQCNTNLACEFDQTIIFRPTTPPIKRKKKNKVWLARLISSLGHSREISCFSSTSLIQFATISPQTHSIENFALIFYHNFEKNTRQRMFF